MYRERLYNGGYFESKASEGGNLRYAAPDPISGG